MKFGLNHGVGGGSGLTANPAFIEYLMGNIFRDDSMEAYLYNTGNTRSVNYAKAFASNHIYLTGTQKVPYPILHDLGIEEVTTTDTALTNADETTTYTKVSDSAFNIAVTVAGTNSTRPLMTNSISSISADTVHKISFDAVVNSGNLAIRGTNIGQGGIINIDYEIVDGYNEIIITTIETTSDQHIYFNGTILGSVDITNWSQKEITLPTSSYFSYFDHATNSIVQLSADGDVGATLPVSTHYIQEDSHQFSFNSTIPLSAKDVDEIKADPNLAFRMFFDGEVLPSGFSNTDVGNFWGGNEGLASGAFVQDLATDLGTEEIDSGTDYANWPILSDAGVTVDATGVSVTADGATFVDAKLAVALEADTYYVVAMDVLQCDSSYTAFRSVEFTESIEITSADIGKYGLIIKTNTSAVTTWHGYYTSDDVSGSVFKMANMSFKKLIGFAEIGTYDSATRTTLANQSNGASNLKLIRDGSGRTTGTAVANTTQWEADGRTAVTNWTITAPFTVAEVIDGDTYIFTSTGNRYKNLILDGTYTVPTGIWTLDEFGFDGVTSVTVRGATGVIDEVVVP